MLILPHPAIPIPFPASRQIPIDDAAAHTLPAGAGADEVPGVRFERGCGSGLVFSFIGFLAIVVVVVLVVFVFAGVGGGVCGMIWFGGCRWDARGDGLVDLAAHEDVSGFVAEGAGFAVGFGGGFWFGHRFVVFLVSYRFPGVPSNNSMCGLSNKLGFD